MQLACFLICFCFFGFCCLLVFCCVWLPGFCQAQFFGSYFFDRLGICPFDSVLTSSENIFFNSCACFRYAFSTTGRLLCLILHMLRCPVYRKMFSMPAFRCVILCRHVFSLFCFPLFFTRKRFYLHIIYIRHTWIRVLEDSPFALGLSSLCLYYSTYFPFFNPECCIKRTKPFGANRRTPSLATKIC